MLFAIAILFALFAWWFSTGAVLYLIGMPRQTFPLSMAAVSVAAALAVFGLWSLGSDQSLHGAFAGFACGLVVWAWHEMSFLMGFVTGARTDDCPAGARGWRRFSLATQTLIYHEVAIALTAVVLLALTWGEPNQVGTLTFVVLWLARLSAKFNVFLGVPNLTEEFLPRHLVYLKTYFRSRPMNLLFPISVTASTIVTALFIQNALADAAPPVETAGWMLLSALMALVVVEHWMLVLPLRSAELWRWGMASRGEECEPPRQGPLNETTTLHHARLLSGRSAS